MRVAHDHHGRQFDVVIACDNSIPRLLSDDEILTAFRQMFACTRPGGGCLVTVRDFRPPAPGGSDPDEIGHRAPGFVVDDDGRSCNLQEARPIFWVELIA